MKIPAESICRKRILHAFEVSRDLPDALIEVCIQCSKKMVYNKKDGNIDNRKYMKHHFRDTLQPFGRTGKLFRKIYGESPIKNLRSKLYKQKDTRTHEELRQDIQKRVKRQYI